MLCVSPGIDIKNRYFSKLKKKTKEYLDFMKAHIPINRMASIKEISNLILIYQVNILHICQARLLKLIQGN